MSFSLSFRAANKAEAFVQLATAVNQSGGAVPDSVQTFLRTAIQHVHKDGIPITVIASGHLCSGGPSSHDASSVTMSVTPS